MKPKSSWWWEQGTTLGFYHLNILIYYQLFHPFSIFPAIMNPLGARRFKGPIEAIGWREHAIEGQPLGIKSRWRKSLGPLSLKFTIDFVELSIEYTISILQ